MRVWDLGFRVQGLGFRVWDLRFRELYNPSSRDSNGKKNMDNEVETGIMG